MTGVANTQPLRIALYSPKLPESGGSNGIITYTKIMRSALRSSGHSVLIITPEAVEFEDGDVVPLPGPNKAVGALRSAFESLRLNDGSNAWARLRLFDGLRVARRANVQVLEIEESFGWAGQLAGRGLPVVERLHGPHAFIRSDVETVQQRAASVRRELAEKAAIMKIQALISPTERLMDEVTQLWGRRPAIWKIIPNPVPVAPDGDRWHLNRVDSEQILFVGRFDRLKGADILIRAFAQALERRPTLKLVIVGPDYGLPTPKGELIHFEEFVAAEIPPAARARIRFLGEQSVAEVTKLRAQSAIALVLSRFENFPYSIAEAMAQGMPVITSATFGGLDMVRDSLDGRVVPLEDVPATSNAILEMVTDPERLAAMGHSAYERVRTWLAPDRIAEESVKLYRTVLSHAGRGSLG